MGRVEKPPVLVTIKGEVCGSALEINIGSGERYRTRLVYLGYELVTYTGHRVSQGTAELDIRTRVTEGLELEVW